MNQYAVLIRWIIIAVLALALFFGGLAIGCSHKKDNAVVNSNNAFILQDSSREVVYTQSQFEDKLKAETDLIKALGIKTKQLTHYICVPLTLKDSVTIANLINPPAEYIFDTVNYDIEQPEIRFFEVVKPCWSISGYSTIDSTVLEPVFKTQIATYLYWSYNKSTFLKRVLTTKGGISIFDFSKYNDAISISLCNFDTLSIQKNVNIIRR